MSQDIKETKELIEGVKLLAVAGAKIAKDGINVADLQHLVELAKNFEVIQKAFENVKEVEAEIKDLEESELIELVGVLYSLVKEVKEAV
jgi:hypothetical protein